MAELMQLHILHPSADKLWLCIETGVMMSDERKTRFSRPVNLMAVKRSKQRVKIKKKPESGGQPVPLACHVFCGNVCAFFDPGH
jgi:hypothetical protein